MKEDFELVKDLNIIEVSKAFYQEPDKRGFVRSPATKDKTRSLKLYGRSNTFCDFANGNYGGDSVGFIAYTLNMSNWEALKLLKNYFGLSNENENQKSELIRKIRLQKQKEAEEKEQRIAFGEKRKKRITDLKIELMNLQGNNLEPFSEQWAIEINQSLLINYKLDILCGGSDDEINAILKEGEKIGKY